MIFDIVSYIGTPGLVVSGIYGLFKVGSEVRSFGFVKRNQLIILTSRVSIRLNRFDAPGRKHSQEPR
jgi:hypothetical protein